MMSHGMWKILLIFTYSLSASAQNPECSMSVVGGRTYIYACQGIDKEKAEQIELILDQILRGGLDPSAVRKKLAEISGGTNNSLNITPKQKADLIKSAKLGSGVRANVIYLRGDPNGAGIAATVTEILSEGGWRARDGGVLGPASIYTSDQPSSGIRVEINEKDYISNKYPDGAIPLSFTLRSLKLGGLLAVSEEVPPGTIQLRIGRY